MKIIDISMAIRPDMPVYKNLAGKRPAIEVISDFNTGDIYESRITMDMHTGTHMDAPRHMIADGGTIGNAALEKHIAKCTVIDLTHISGGITASELMPCTIPSGYFVLLKTRNSFVDRFDESFVFLEEGGAKLLKEKGVIGVGIDSLGIERNQPGHPTHKLLLGSGITILEGLRLRHVAEGEYTLIALPLKIEGAEASPVRAVLLDGFGS